MDIVEEIGWRLGVLASRDAQDRYMVNATPDVYLLIEEAVEDALGLAEPRLIQRMNAHTRASVSRFLLVLRAEMDHFDTLPRMPWDPGILEDHSLRAVRLAACSCLAEIGFELSDWERREGYAT